MTFKHLAPPINIPMYDHQKACYDLVYDSPRCALLMEQGTGKTLVAIALIGARYLRNELNKVLIVAPLSVIPFWLQEFTRATYPCKIVDLSELKPTKRDKAIKELDRFKGVKILIINYESTWRFYPNLLAWDPEMIIADESQKIKNPKAKQAKAMHKLSDGSPLRMILTGTPITQSPLDVWSQYRFLSPSLFGYNYYRFRYIYAVMGGYGNHQVIAYRNLEDLAKKAHSIAYRVTKEEALDLPPWVDQILYVTLSNKAAEIYKTLEKDFHALLTSGNTVTVPIILTQLLRLQQITGGFVRTDKDEIEQVDDTKLRELKNLLEDMPTEKKIVIFARFIPEIEAITKEVKNLGRKVVVLRGGVKNRGELIRVFQESPDITVFIAQIQAGGLGITLHAADTVIFYSTAFSYADYEQAKARIHRIGQKAASVTYIHLLAKSTIDEEVLMALKQKRDIAEYIVDKLKAA